MICTAEHLLEVARKGRPEVRYTQNKNGTAIGAWDASAGVWRTIAGKCLDGHWVSVGDLFINEEPVNKQCDWLPESVLA